MIAITPTRIYLALCVSVVVFTCIVTFYKLGDLAFLDYDEATYADVMRETSQSGQLVTMQHSLIGNNFEKPPLYFWLGMFTKKITGLSEEWSYRLPAALAGVLSVVLVMLIAYTITKNPRDSALAGIILATTGLYIEAARQVRLDIPMITAVLFAFFSYLRARENPKWYLGLGLGVAVAFMTKSVLGLLIFPAMIIFSIVYRDFSWLRSKHFWFGGGIALILVLPWHIAESLKFGKDFWNVYLVNHIFSRYQSAILSGGVSETAFSYIPRLFRYSLPWMLVFLGSIFTLRKRQILAPFFVTIFIYIFFEISRTKLLYYFLPIFPFMALTSALFISHIFDNIKSTLGQYIATGVFCVLVIVGIITTIPVVFHTEKVFGIDQLIATEEREIGLILAKHQKPLKIYTYQYKYLDTIRYYSGGRHMNEMQDGDILDESFYLIMSKPLFDSVEFPPELKDRLQPLYTGESVTLLLFNL